MKFNWMYLVFSLFIYLNAVAVQSHAQLSEIPNQGPNHGGLNLFQTLSRRSLLSHHDIDIKQDNTLVTFSDGTIYLVEENGKDLWSLRTDPISSLHEAVTSDKEIMSVGDGETQLQLDELHSDGKFSVDWGDGDIEMELVKILEDNLSGVPNIPKGRTLVGQKKFTILTVDFRTGKVIDVYDPSGGKNALCEMNTNAVVIGSPTDQENVKLLELKRAEYTLLSFSQAPKTLLWSLTFSRIEATFVDKDMELRVPVFHVRNGTHVQFIRGISMLHHKDGKPVLAPGSDENFTALVNAGNTGLNSMLYSINRKTDQNLRNAISNETDQNIRNAASSENTVLHHSRFSVRIIVCILLVSALCCSIIIIIIRQKSTKDSMGSTGKNTIVPKRKKARKLTNYKNGAKSTVYDDEQKFNGLSSYKRKGKQPWSGLEIPVDADVNGRMIGKMCISNTEIAKGSNGTVVMEGIYDGRPVAVKRLVKAHHDVAYKEIQNLIASDRHPNIVRWYGVEYDSNFVYLSLERCTCSLGDLIKMCSDSSSHLISPQGMIINVTKECNDQLDMMKGMNKNLYLWKKNGFPSWQLLRLMRDIVSGLVHLHELGIIHRDLKPQNILILNEKSLCAKLSDMGISKRLMEDKSSLGCHPTGYGSSGWQAPEQLLHGRQTRAVDLFGLGCVLFFCITGGKHPYGDHLERDINIVKNRVDLFMVEHIPEAVDLISHLLDPNPELRPTALHVLRHPLFWSSETRLSFLRDVSDRVELEDRENKSDLLDALENVGPLALGGNWDAKMEAIFLNNIGRYRRYKFDSTRDLLRVIRNKLNHYRELPKEIQELLGPIPEGFDAYFSSRFPKFLIEVYNVMYRFCTEEECFGKYFRTV